MLTSINRSIFCASPWNITEIISGLSAFWKKSEILIQHKYVKKICCLPILIVVHLIEKQIPNLEN